MSVEAVILVDNTSASADLVAEHGLAMLVSGPGLKVLFDAAATGEALLSNARRLEVDLHTLDAVVISHGHSDHTGGLIAAVQECPGLRVFVHSGAFNRRWSDHPGRPLKDISCPHSIERLYQSGAVFHSVSHVEPLADWLLISGPIGGPRHGGDVFVVRKGAEMVVDGFEDEMCLLARGQTGWAVLTGCCHRGLRNTLRTARFLTHDEPLTALVGGLHLGADDPAGLQEALELIAEYRIPDVYPCHCTSAEAVAALRQALPGRVHPLAVGSRMIF